MRHTLLLTGMLLLTGCATLRTPTPERTPCEDWRAVEAAWSAVDTYVRQLLAAERAAACPLPAPPLPAPGPAEPVPPNPTAPPAQVPLPGLRPRDA